ncbi:hypothetical protein GCM10010387_07400 [Streptomyces inusitatus]|uniref:Uncharacterized protein n=1 Tax=Streptomyces inusitatus TaxID=68221 RepID=A0A918UKW4_9ACTN|nr:hypothetical protein GCM10010387_07400 [Streptomyces inusitatus]
MERGTTVAARPAGSADPPHGTPARPHRSAAPDRPITRSPGYAVTRLRGYANASQATAPRIATTATTAMITPGFGPDCAEAF